MFKRSKQINNILCRRQTRCLRMLHYEIAAAANTWYKHDYNYQLLHIFMTNKINTKRINLFSQKVIIIYFSSTSSTTQRNQSMVVQIHPQKIRSVSVEISHCETANQTGRDCLDLNIFIFWKIKKGSFLFLPDTENVILPISVLVLHIHI